MTARREHLIADEAGAAVRAAQDALNEQVRRGAVTNDPLRHYLEAMSVALGAMHKMFVDGTLTIAAAVEEAKPQPVDNDTLRAAVTLGIRTQAGGILRTLKLATYIAGATLLLSTFAAGYGIHWWMTRQPFRTPVSAKAPTSANRVLTGSFVASPCSSPSNDPGTRSQQSPFTLRPDSPRHYDSVVWVVRTGETKWRQSALRGARRSSS